MTRLAKRLVLASTAVVLSIAPAVLAPSAAHAKAIPVVQRAGAVANEVVSTLQENTSNPPAAPITH